MSYICEVSVFLLDVKLPDDGLHITDAMDDFSIIKAVLSVPVINLKLYVVTVESVPDRCGRALVKKIRSAIYHQLLSFLCVFLKYLLLLRFWILEQEVSRSQLH